MQITNNSILNNEYDFIFSLGEACATTSILRASDLQFQSYPFDWLFGGNISARTDILVNNFDNFINKNDLSITGTRKTPLPCSIYKNNSNGLFFNHDFSLNGNFDNDYNSVKEKYDRRTKRLLSNIENADKILIAYIQIPNNKLKSLTKISSTVKKVYAKLKQKWPNKEIDLIYFVNKKPLFKEIRYKKIQDNILLIECDYKDTNKNSEPHSVNGKVLCDFFKNVKLNKKVIKNQEKKNAKNISNNTCI